MSADVRGFFDTAFPPSRLALQLTEYNPAQRPTGFEQCRGAILHRERNHVSKSKFKYLERLKQSTLPGEVPEILHQTSMTLSLIMLSTVLFIVAAWFSQASFASSTGYAIQSKVQSAFNLSISSFLTILRIIQAALSTCSLFAVLQTFELLAWSFASQEAGVGTLCFLGLSPTTGMIGNFGIGLGKHVGYKARLSVALKLSLSAMIWIAGVLLFANTNLNTVYRSAFSYNVTAGVGPFKGQFVPEFLDSLANNNPQYNYSILPYGIITASSSLLTNTMNARSTTPIVDCASDRVCNSYILTGGLLLTDPWGSKEFQNDPVITILNAPATQIDYIHGEQNVSFNDLTDCAIYGQQNYLIGIKFCLSRDEVELNSLYAKLFVCQGNVAYGECLVSDSSSISTKMSVYTRFATFDTARNNFTILSIQVLGEALQQSEIDIENLKLSFSWLFNFSAANIPGSSAAAFSFFNWDGQGLLSNDMWNIQAYQLFESLLAFPFWHFQENNFGNVQLQSQNITQGLSADFYTTATIGIPFLQIEVERGMFIAFCALQSIVIGFVWSVLIWLWITKLELPEVSAYPLIDFATKTDWRSLQGQVGYTQNKSCREDIGLSNGSSCVRKILRNDVTTLKAKRNKTSIDEKLLSTQRANLRASTF